MEKYPRPTKQFDFLGDTLRKLSQTQRSLTRRTDFRGVPFNNGVGSQSKEISEAILAGQEEAYAGQPEWKEVQEIEMAWSEADGFEITGPSFITFTQKGQDLLTFTVAEQFTFMWYSNERYFIDTVGVIKAEQ